MVIKLENAYESTTSDLVLARTQFTKAKEELIHVIDHVAYLVQSEPLVHSSRQFHHQLHQGQRQRALCIRAQVYTSSPSLKSWNC
jgi:ABC-type lipoprotein export system ATPase subunit